MAKKMHLALFSEHGPGNVGWWNDPRSGTSYDWREPEVYQDVAAICERGKFDLIVFADILSISNYYQGSKDAYIRHALDVANHDPIPLIAMMAAKTQHIGIAATLSTTYYPPFLLAKLIGTLDHLTKGRVGWNVVTSYSPSDAQNFGLEEILEHDERYERAEEYMELCYKLWGSWEPDAVVMDKKNAVFADPRKVHEVNFAGRYFNCKGPLTVVSSPQRRPVIIQAGSSERGKEFAAKHAEIILTNKNTISDMKAFYDDVKSRMKKYGRDPDDCKILFTTKPIIGETEEIVEARIRENERNASLEAGLAYLSSRFLIDLSKYDLDKPLPDLEIKGVMGKLLQYSSAERPPTLREIARHEALHETFPIRGTPEQVADTFQQVMDEVGGDGFAIRASCFPYYLVDFVDGVIPILQKRGLVRSEYKGKTLRENLMEF